MKLERRTRKGKVIGRSLLRGASLIVVLVSVVFSFFFVSTQQKAQLVPLYTVRNTSDTVVAGACTGNTSGCSLRGAIVAANAVTNSVIRFNIPQADPFCSAGVCTINLTQLLPAMTSDVAIEGPGADKLTVRRTTGGSYSVFYVSASTVTISGLTISNGIANAVTSNNGGGVATWPLGPQIVTLNVTDCTISGNQAASNGGGIFSGHGTLNVRNSTISGNNAGTSAGGISFGGATLNVINSTITGNSSSIGGGIVFAGSSTHNVTNSTISHNSASASAGGVRKSAGTPSVKNSIIALNTAPESPDVSGGFFSAGFNLIGKTDGSSGFTASTDQTGTIAAPLNPMLNPAGLQNSGGRTGTISLMNGSPAIDKGTSSGLTGSLTTDQRGIGFPRIYDNPAIPNPAGGDGTDIGAFERRGNVASDFEGDGKTDLGIFRPSDGTWWINRSSTATTSAVAFGTTTDRIAPADFTGDGKADIAFWRPSTGSWFIIRSEDSTFFAFPFGLNEDIPSPADYDNDGRADAAVFRPSNNVWFILRSSDGGTTFQQFGSAGDVPVTADYDGDGRADIAIYRPSVGQWWVNRSTAGVLAVGFGDSTDKPVPGDFTGDGKADVAVYRPSTGVWFILRSEDFSFYGFPFGTVGDIPAPGDYDGDGKFDATVFRPSQATWYSQRSTAGTLIQQFGATGDQPIPSAFVR